MKYHDPFRHKGLVLNVLTRTCNRPNRFRRCRESVLAQKWGGTVRQFVSIDRPCTYAEGDVIIPATGNIAPEIPSEHVRHRDAPYNLYVNDLLAAVRGGWVLVLDDDDELLTTDAFSKLEPYMADENNMIVFKFAMGSGDGRKRFAMPHSFERGLIINDTPCSCYIYSSRHKELGVWHGKYSGDFYAAQNLASKLNIVWVDEVIAGTQIGPSTGVNEDQSKWLSEHWKPHPMPNDKKDPMLSIIIPVCNQSEWTKKTLEQIRETVHMPHEVIVIDNGSTDDTQKVVKGRAGVRSIRNKKNHGVYVAWNQGCSEATGTHFAILNNDLLLPDGWAERLMAHDRHAICPTYEQAAIEREDFAKRNARVARNPDVSEADRPGMHPKGFAGFCFILSREAWERTGRFDEGYRYWYGDNDYWLRLREMGFIPFIASDVLIHHYMNKTCKDMDDFLTQRESERRIFLKRWPGAA